MTLPQFVGPASPGAAWADPGTFSEITIPATMQVTPRDGTLSTAGSSGFLHYVRATGMVWTGADGSTRTFPGTEPYGRMGYYGAASDVVAMPPVSGTGDVLLRNMATDETTKVTVPVGQRYDKTVGSTVLALGGKRPDGFTYSELHLLTGENGTTVDRRVTGFPDGAYFHGNPDAGVHGALLRVSVPEQPSVQFAWIDFETAEATPLPLGTVYANSAVTAFHLVTPQAGGVRLYEQGRFDAPVREVQVSLKDGARILGVVGDALVVGRYDATLGQRSDSASVWKVVAVPFDGSQERTLLARAAVDQVAVRPDGGVQIVGGQSAEDYGYQSITAGPDGSPYTRRVLRLPPVPMLVQRLTVDHGTVRTLEYGDGATYGYVRPLTADGPGYGDRSQVGGLNVPYHKCSSIEPLCPELYATGDGRTVYRGMTRVGDQWRPEMYVVGKGGAFPGTPVETGLQDSYDESAEQSHIVGVSENLLLVAGTPVGGSKELRVVDIDSGRVVHKEPYRLGTIWGTTLWTSDGDRVTAEDARTGAALTSFRVGDACRQVIDLQSVGRWLYWRCYVTNTPYVSGVYDLQSKRNIPVPDSGQVHLGDGLLVESSPKELAVYGLQSGTAVRQWSAAGNVMSAFDPRTGDLAFHRPDQIVRVLRTGRPVAPLVSPYRYVSSVVDSDATPVPWRAEWWLSEPAASWKVEILDRATGRAVATRAGGAAVYSIATAWDGRDAAGALLPNGSYTWRLTAQPQDGQGSALVQSGTVRLTGGTAVWRDHVGGSSLPDGIGDLLTLNSSGGLTFQQGTGGGTFDWKVTAGGWSTSTVAVPFGDLNGDFCNDVLIRMPDGSLRGYEVPCGKAPAPTMPYVKIGTGYGQYNVLTSPGDLTGDGRPDLLARKSSTGDVYLFAAKSGGTLAWPQKIRPSWSAYTHVVGAGDLNGDGRGDVLARDKAGTLWRYDGLGNGLLKDRVQVFTKWGNGYNAIVGVGDITGDGRDDLIERDGAGSVFLNAGNGRGSFGARVLIATGWQGYKGIF
ncbi:FG-GAP-like repeat-containing protein [Streptomyces griseosporeus]|uniref:FG-GAP-like repeat-containing protein n=1 Tax=Streptomyces griseosporeus TaxID=1910 RepID=UPI00367A02B7